MSRRITSHIRSNVVGYAALFVALSGTAYAAGQLPKNSVGTKQIKSNAVNGAKVADGSLTGADVNASTLGTAPNATHAANSDQLGGLPPSAFQHDLSGGCPSNEAVQSISDDGTPSCGHVSPIGSASGSLSCAYPNPSIGSGAVGTSQFGTIPAARVTSPIFISNPCIGNLAPNDSTFRVTFSGSDFDNDNIQELDPLCAPLPAITALKAPVAGTYLITAQLEWAANATNERRIAIEDQFTMTHVPVEQQAVADAGKPTQQSVSAILHLAQDEPIALKAYQNSGGDLGIGQGSLAMTWLGP
jgi:hypothetical protein